MDCPGISQVITWLLVIAGWLTVNAQHNSRETRKEIRSKIDAVRERIEELEREAIHYHTTAHDYQRAQLLKSYLQHLWTDASLIKIVPEAELGRSLATLRRAMTLRNFDASDHVALDLDDEQIAQISVAIADLATLLERGYMRRYHK